MPPTRCCALYRITCRYACLAFALLVAATLAIAARADAPQAPRLEWSPAERAWLNAHPIIRLGVDTRYPPYSYLDQNGQFQGIVRDHVAYLASVLGVHFDIVATLDRSQLLDAVRERRIDAVATVAHLPERDAFLEFTRIYLPTPLVVMTRDSTPQLTSLESLENLNVTLVRKSSSSALVLEAFPQLHPRYVATPRDGLAAVSSGLADAYIGVIGVNTHLAAKHGYTNLKVNAGFDMKTNGQRFGVRKDWPELARLFDRALEALPEQRRQDIFNRWLPVRVETLERLSQPSLLNRLAPWLAALLGVASLAYVGTAVWNRTLKRELERRQGELAKSTSRLRAAEAIAHVGNWSCAAGAPSFEWSDEVYRIFGIAPGSRVPTYDWLIQQVLPEDRARHDSYVKRMLDSRPGERIPELRYRVALAAGEVRTVCARAEVDYDETGTPRTLFGTVQDISDQIRIEEGIAALNRLYRVLSGINKAIVRRRNPQALFDEACRIAVDVGEFRMAWVGAVDPDSLRVAPLAWAGYVEGYLDGMRVSTGEDGHAQGPTGTALRAGKHTVSNDIARDPHMTPWRDAALSRGYRSSGAFPIRVGGQIRAVLNLYADHAGFFDQDELTLLDELAQEIGFALEFIEIDTARETLNQRMLDLLDNMSDGFVSLDRNACFRYVNRKAGELLGREPAALVGQPLRDAFPDQAGQPFQQACERALQGEDMVRLEYLHPPTGQWYENRLYRTQDGLSVFLSEITARKKSEEALKRLHTMLNALVAGSTDIIFVKDREGRYLIGNEALARALGRSRDDIVGKNDFDLFPPESARTYQADDRRIMDGGVTRTYEETLEAAGRHYSYLTTKGPLVIDGEVSGVFGIARDITARKETETALAESESRLRLFIEHAPAALAMFDRDMHYLAASRRWLTAYHLERSDIVGESHYDVFPDLPERWKTIHRRGLDGELVRATQDRFERADGSVQWISWEMRPWFAADSSVGGIVIFSEDISERIQAEQSLRESEARFAATFEQAAVGLALVSTDGRWLQVNQKLCDIVGYSDDELRDLTFQDITHPDDLTTDLDNVRRMLAREIETYSMEKRYVRKDGLPVWINLTVALVWKDAREPDYFVKVVEDIGARKAVEAALHESEAHYRLLFERNPAPMLVYERGSLDLLAVNEAFVEHYGYRADAIRSLKLTDLYPDDEKQAITDFAARLHGLAYVGEWHHLRHDGSRITIDARSHDIDFEGHEARVAVITDITQRKASELAIQKSEARYRSLVEMAPFPAVLTRMRDGVLVYGNHRAETQYGISRDQGIGLSAERFYQDKEQRERFVDALRRDGKVNDFEVRMLTANGQPFWALVSASIVEFDNEPAIFTAINDITARKQMENEIRRFNTELEERVRQRTADLAAANKELETFTYSVSHDLKAPLRGIDGYSRLLLDDYHDRLDDEGRQLVENVRKGVAQMSQLIEDLLDYSRMERRSIHEQSLAVLPLIEQVLANRHADIETRGMQIDVDVGDLTARADPDGLTIVIRNLVDNALKFTRDSRPPRLSITGQVHDKSVILKFADNGIGFDMQFHHRIFEIFQRLQRAEEYAGTGIGLAIVQKAMQRMGGRVWADSAPGEGARFYLELPR